eukprot:scaffold92551_cov32-Tisochrysis_lutea.AAC.6
MHGARMLHGHGQHPHPHPLALASCKGASSTPSACSWDTNMNMDPPRPLVHLASRRRRPAAWSMPFSFSEKSSQLCWRTSYRSTLDAGYRVAFANRERSP